LKLKSPNESLKETEFELREQNFLSQRNSALSMYDPNEIQSTRHSKIKYLKAFDFPTQFLTFQFIIIELLNNEKRTNSKKVFKFT